MKKIYFLAIFIGFSCLKVNGQFIINGEFRPRVGYFDGYRQLATQDVTSAFGISQRSRLGFYYTKDWLKTGFSIQDVRVWGDETLYSGTGVYGDNASLDVNEVWVQLSFLKYSSLKIGRQILEYDDARLISRRNWNQNSVSYDALLYNFIKQKWTVNAVLSFNNDAENVFGNPYTNKKMKTIDFLRVNHQFTDKLEASATFILSGSTKNETSDVIYFKESYAAYIQYKKDNTKIWGSYYYQGGQDIKSGYSKNVSAYNFNIYGSHTFNKVLLGLGATVLSGDKNKGADTTQTNLFDLLYGTRHRYYGLMDYFNNLGSSTKNGGLVDLFVNVGYQFNPKFSLQADYHYFSLHQLPNPALVNDQVLTKKGLGSELDLTFTYKIIKIVELTGGYSIMLPTNTMEVVQNIVGITRFSSWAWLMLTVKPEFFRWDGK